MKNVSNKAGNVLKERMRMLKKEIVYLFLCRVHQNFILLCLVQLKLGAIVGPLFEAFMEGAVRDRLEDSEAKVIVTTPELLQRVPVDELPHLKHIFLVGENIEENG